MGNDSGMPPRDDADRKYSRDDVEHLVAREVAKQRLHDVERNLDQLRADTGRQYATIQAGIESINDQFQRMYTHVDECRTEMRSEMERDFATKTEMVVLEGKVDKLASKIMIGVAVAVAMIQGGFKMWDSASASHVTTQHYQQPSKQ